MFTHYSSNPHFGIAKSDYAGSRCYARKSSAIYSPTETILILENARRNSFAVNYPQLAAFRHGGDKDTRVVTNGSPDYPFDKTGAKCGVAFFDGHVGGKNYNDMRFEKESKTGMVQALYFGYFQEQGASLL